ncbi:MAG TPA: tRNA-dihydrouridine synthase [Candidatus Nanoarchaeia archaeon]|nr:tRNA-dihydrouridine synthase [Candidatus Nanoarchaeia archaeon]
MQIGNVEVPNQFALAPMAAVNCTAFRMLCKENGAGLIYTQRFDTGRINEKSSGEIKKFLNIHESEHPVAVQIIGDNAVALADAAKRVESFADIIDLNLGCGDEEFAAQGSGAALLKGLDKVEEIVNAVVTSVRIPVTAKIRIGVDSQHINGVTIAQSLERAGIAAIAVHGRTIEQKYSGKVNWTIMKQIKEKISVPVIANGDIKSYDEGLDMLKKTGCDIVMVGREAKHRPWVFNPDKQRLNNEGVCREILRFLDLYEKHESRSSAREAGEHVFWMLRDFRTKKNTREFMNMESIAMIREALRAL